MGSWTCAALIMATSTLLLQQVNCLGCIPKLCDSNENNVIRRCPDGDNTCGSYHGMRFGNRLVDGVDILCSEGAVVYAPFSGELSYHSPFGDHSCTDKGLKIAGEGQWQGYYAVLSYVEPFRTGGRVEKGKPVGRSLSHNCRTGTFDPHILFELYKRGKPIDPTYHVRDCFCTGQVCSTNNNNEMKLGSSLPWKIIPEMGKGFELKCPDTSNEYIDSHGLPTNAPEIMSPITGSRFGRFRLKSEPSDPCMNEGIFVIGRAPWTDFTVHIYNAQFILVNETKLISELDQGQVIGRRLSCPGHPVDSVFMEIRYRGRHVNVTDMILGTKCQKPEM